MTTVVVISIAGLAWMFISAIVVGMCVAARHGDEGPRPTAKAVRLRRVRLRDSRPRPRSAP